MIGDGVLGCDHFRMKFILVLTGSSTTLLRNAIFSTSSMGQPFQRAFKVTKNVIKISLRTLYYHPFTEIEVKKSIFNW